jgi:hypothetical protein
VPSTTRIAVWSSMAYEGTGSVAASFSKRRRKKKFHGCPCSWMVGRLPTLLSTVVVT